MTAATAEQQRQSQSGFANLLGRENRLWWGTRRWLLQTLVGVLGMNGLLAIILFVLPGIAAAAGEPIDAREAGTQIFFGLSALAFAVDVIIVTQDTIIGEKESGVAEWVLSKPVSRTAYVMAKFVANAAGFLVTLIIIPGIVAYILFLLAGVTMPLGSFLAAEGVVALHTLFYLALSLLMGVIANSTGTLLAVTLGSVLGGAILVDFIGGAAFLTPWPLGNIAVGIAMGAPLPPIAWAPIIATAVWTVVALAVAVWRFGKAEL